MLRSRVLLRRYRKFLVVTTLLLLVAGALFTAWRPASSAVLPPPAMLVSAPAPAVAVLPRLTKPVSLPPPRLPQPSAPSLAAPVALVGLRVLAEAGDARGLQRILAELAASDFRCVAGEQVPLVIDVNAPTSAASTAETSAHASALQLAWEFQWPFGPKFVLARELRATPLEQWLDDRATSGKVSGKGPQLPSLQLRVHQAVAVSPWLYRWAVQAARQYHKSPHLLALSPLKNQQNWVTLTALDIDNRHVPLLSTAPGPGGALLPLPGPWAHFRQWVLVHRAHIWPGLPAPLQNSTWAALPEPERWLARFVAEAPEPYYTLRPNFLPVNVGLVAHATPEAARAAGQPLVDVLLQRWNVRVDMFPAVAELQRYNWAGLRVAVCPGACAVSLGATCQNHLTGYRCVCAAGTAGRFCNVLLRPPSPGSVSIKVLVTETSPSAVGRLLRSLTQSNYSRDIVSLDIFFPPPPTATHADDGVEAAAAAHTHCADLAERWEWPHGTKQVVYAARPQSPWEQVRAASPGTAPEEQREAAAFVVIRETVEVAPGFYGALKDALRVFAHRPDIFGVALDLESTLPLAGGHAWQPALPLSWATELAPPGGQQAIRAYASANPASAAFMPLPKAWGEFLAWQDAQNGHWPILTDFPEAAAWYDSAVATGALQNGPSGWLAAFADANARVTIRLVADEGILARDWHSNPVLFDPLASKTGTRLDFARPLVAAHAVRLIESAVLPFFSWAGDSVELCNNGPAACHSEQFYCADHLHLGAQCLCKTGEDCVDEPRAQEMTAWPDVEAPAPLTAWPESNDDAAVVPYTAITKADVQSLVTNSDGALILVTVSRGFVDFYNNWRLAIEKLGLGFCWLAIAEDIPAYRYLSRVLPAGRVFFGGSGDAARDSTGGAYRYNSTEYNLLVGHRARYLLHLLKLGVPVLYSDIDMVWLESPFPELRDSDVDFFIASDADQPEDYPEHMLCTGFMFLKPKRQILAFMADWNEALQNFDGRNVNQEVFNQLLREKHKEAIRLKILSYSKFPSGAIYFWYPEWIARQSVGPAVVHANFMVGHDKKRARFIEYKLWLDGADVVIDDQGHEVMPEDEK